MDIIILADFCGNFDGKGNSRFLYLADMLSKDHDVEILTSDFNHGTKTYFENEPSGYPYKITMVHEEKYSQNVSLQRFYGHYVWSRSIKKYLNARKKPDVVYAAIPPLAAPLIAAKYCEKERIRFVADIQDLWPEAFQMVFNVPFLSNLIFAPFKTIANGIYKRADAICGVSRTYVKRGLKVNHKGATETVAFLGTDLAYFDRNVANYPVNKRENELWLGYCGSMGNSYDLNCVIDALALLDNPPVFIAMGDGQKRNEFEARAKEKGVKAIFTGFIPYNQMCGRLAKCDILVNPIVGRSAASIINKHADYASAGLPILNTQECPEYRELINGYKMGFNCKNGDPADLATKMKLLIENKKLRIEMGKNARRCAKEKFDRRTSYSALIECIVK